MNGKRHFNHFSVFWRRRGAHPWDEMEFNTPARLLLCSLSPAFTWGSETPKWPHVLFTLPAALCIALVPLALVIQAQLSCRTSPWKSPPGLHN